MHRPDRTVHTWMGSMRMPEGMSHEMGLQRMPMPLAMTVVEISATAIRGRTGRRTTATTVTTAATKKMAGEMTVVEETTAVRGTTAVAGTTAVRGTTAVTSRRSN